MAKNARQKRTAKRKLALALLAHDRNPTMVAQKGNVRSVWTKTMPPRAHIPFHGTVNVKRPTLSRWSLK